MSKPDSIKCISQNDVQIKDGIRDIEFSYKRIAELQELLNSDNIYLAYQAKQLIKFFSQRIEVIQTALKKAGVMKY